MRSGLLMIGCCVVGLVVTILTFESTTLDLRVQDLLFDEVTGRWLVARNAQPQKMIFYTLPKYGAIALGVALAVTAVGPSSWRAALRISRRAAWFVIACLAVAPATVGLAKDLTGVACPSQIMRYGGERPYRRLAEAVRKKCGEERPARCFPAAHPTTAFALLSLAWVWVGWRRRLIAGALAFGWTVGLYQMARGAHFLSHVVVTMLWVSLLVVSLALLFRPEPHAVPTERS